uniref:Reticulon n=1 Tax=Sinocyclocheilus anshuiensis TaxID=1608454 RepID=A0A671MG06_9TELE
MCCCLLQLQARDLKCFAPVQQFTLFFVTVSIRSSNHATHTVFTCSLCRAVNDLVHWRDPKKSGVVFGVSLLLLLSLAAFSVISVVSYLYIMSFCITSKNCHFNSVLL